MTDITTNGQSTLPAPNQLEMIEVRCRKLIDLLAASYRRDDDPKFLRSLLAGIESALETQPQLQSDLSAIERQATKKELADYLSILRIAFPNAKAAGDGFARVLVERVAAKQPSLAALDWAVRSLIDGSNFLPTISEVLHALAVANDRIQFAALVCRKMPALRDEVAARLCDAERIDRLRHPA